ncbi:hypothetical protein ES705_43340 [subsurface metagenome]
MEIDPDTATLDDPTEDSSFEYMESVFLNRYNDSVHMTWGYSVCMPQTAAPGLMRSYVEWDISSISSDATITLVKFKYHGGANYISIDDGYIYSMAVRPSTGLDQDVFDDCADGTAYYTGKVFPEVGISLPLHLSPTIPAQRCNILKVSVEPEVLVNITSCFNAVPSLWIYLTARGP